MTDEEDTTGTDTPDEQPACHHENLVLASTYDLVNIMYQVEEKMKHKTTEEQLGFLVNSISGVIYAASQVMGIESWVVRDGDKTIQVTPTATPIPQKDKIN